ncbi:hypothetical protein FUSO6_08960 [Fusobacterium necrophorum DAB]|uniref:oligosaccharide flippase family protein n=1 Tax=Fusobacterium necrophorum TaxID=859 RepID=UPI000460C427|nr:oligosaccharide flippase family protein [Fusobacterium necrophorum]KDE68399.1 hypothetical protein FUSO6_08960 [Fusobacterium necrophorum DAB]
MKDMSIVSATKWSIISELLAKLIVPITTMTLARILSLESFGVVTSIMLIITLADDIIKVAFQKVIVQIEIKNTEKIENYCNIVFLGNLLISISLWIFITSFRYKIANFVGIQGKELEIVITGLILPLSSLSTVQESIFIKRLNYKALYHNRCISILIPFVITLPLAIILKNHWALIIGNISLTFIRAIHLTIKSEWMPSLKYNFKLLLRIKNLLLFNLLDASIHWASSWTDILFVTKFFGIHYSALYKMSQTTVTSIISLITSGITAILFSSLSYYKNDHEKFKEIFFNFQKGVAVLALPLAAGFYIYRTTIVQILLGNKWLEASEMVGVLGAVTCLIATYGTFSKEAYRAIGESKVAFYVQALHLAFIIVIFFISFSLNYNEFVIVRSLAFLQILFLHNIYMKKLFDIKLKNMIKNNVYIILISIIMGILGIFFKKFSKNLITDFFGIFMCILFYFILLFRNKEYKNSVLNLLKQYIGKG